VNIFTELIPAMLLTFWLLEWLLVWFLILSVNFLGVLRLFNNIALNQERNIVFVVRFDRKSRKCDCAS